MDSSDKCALAELYFSQSGLPTHATLVLPSIVIESFDNGRTKLKMGTYLLAELFDVIWRVANDQVEDVGEVYRLARYLLKVVHLTSLKLESIFNLEMLENCLSLLHLQISQQA